jgi:hypothetical protein
MKMVTLMTMQLVAGRKDPPYVPAFMAIMLFVLPADVAAQRGNIQPATTARAAAPIDLTGYWVAEITEDWRWRMVTPARGDYQSIPITPAAQKVADAWDPAKDEAAGEQCRSYGTPGLMRAPTRLHVTWLDDNTLKVETDYGMQTRLLHFGNWKSPGGAPAWQGDSLARWQTQGRGAGAGARGGTLTVTTTRLRPGYLRKNGVPYSAETTMTEHWDLIEGPGAVQRILLLLVVEDPVYLQQPWIVPVHFKKETNDAKWDPTPCSAKW